ncbi:hypothetical protein DL96DRAFT_1817184 [Flagelloscypha sp. PMI_526]|nr:hypothetical protein DL96DRAFT_1817184 [Flagelloscypha sp. PMI_526]
MTPLLPLDILSDIPLYVDGTYGEAEDIYACCLASRIFVPAAQRSLFRKLNLGWNWARIHALAELPHLTSYTKCLWLPRELGKISDNSVATILRNIPNVTEIHVSDGFLLADIRSHEDTCSAFINTLSPLIRRFRLTCTPDYDTPELGTFFLSAFTNLRFLSLGGLLLDDLPPLNHRHQITTLEHLELTMDGVQEDSLVVLIPFLATQGCQLRRLSWQTFGYLAKEPTDLPGPAFTEFFAAHSRTLVDLTIISCRPEDVDIVPPHQHPWAPQNLPSLETLRLPAFTTTISRYSHYHTLHENIPWMVTILRTLTCVHPMRQFHIVLSVDNFDELPESTPWHDLDDALQSVYLVSLEEVTWCLHYWEPGSIWLDEHTLQEFSKKQLPRCYERGIVHIQRTRNDVLI